VKNKTLQEALSEYPDAASVELGRLIAAPASGEQGELYEIILDCPIIGLAYEESSGDLRLIVEAGPHLTKFGKVKRLDGGGSVEKG